VLDPDYCVTDDVGVTPVVVAVSFLYSLLA
jgi:hypothetical protein